MAQFTISAATSKFEFGDSTPSTELANIRSMEPWNLSVDTKDVTVSSSTAKEFIVGIPDAGELKIDILYDPDDTSAAALVTALNARKLQKCKVSIPKDSASTITYQTFTFDGYVTGFTPKAPAAEGGPPEASITIKITGAIT